MLTRKKWLRRAAVVALTALGPVDGVPSALAQAGGAVGPVPAADGQSLKIVDTANAFLNTLTEAQRKAAVFAFNDSAQRANWTNFPEGGTPVKRAGVRWGEMTPGQRMAVMALLGTVLSPAGVAMVKEQMAADDIVKATDTGPRQLPADAPQGLGGPGGGNRPPVNFGSDYYFVSFVGTPSATSPWMLQFGGHHLAINATIVGSNVTLSPTLTGGEPLRFTLEGTPVYIVEDEAAQAAALLASLTDAQRAKAVISTQRIDLILGPGHDGQVLQPEGLAGSDMTVGQQAQLLALVESRLGILNADDLAPTMSDIRANIASTYFAWFGPTSGVGAAYFRVTGPTVLMEFSPQATDGDPSDHAHNMYRDPTNEYGAAWTPLK